MRFLNIFFRNSKSKLLDYVNKGAVILDVRTEKEYRTNHISEALHIPLQKLEHRLDDIAQLNRPIVVYCTSGIRSAQATRLLKSYNIDAINGGGIAKVKAALQ